MPVLPIPSPALPRSIPSYPQAYNSIVGRSRAAMGSAGGANGLVVMVANDVDGVCAGRMLTTLLTSDSIPHRMFPVEGYAELEARTHDLEGDSELHTLVLLSLGSLLPISSHFLGRLNPSVHVHVVDSHRPWNLENLFGGGVEGRERVWVWGDDDVGRRALEGERRAFEALEYEPESDSDSDSDSDDDLPRPESSDDDSSADEEPVDDDDDGSPRPRRRRRLDEDGQPKPLSKTKKAKYAQKINKYYQAGTHHGQSVAGTIYMLASALGREDNDLLWLAILGLTHQYISSRIKRDHYDVLHSLYLDEVARLNPPPPPPSSAPSASAASSSSSSNQPNPDDHSIRPSEELRFTLYRHWNLYDSMYHSGYVASKMGIWREKGKGKLQGMLAKMGFSLSQCHQAYANMDISLKRQLSHRMDSIAPEYGLVELTYPSFTRTYGFRSLPLSAADAVEGIGALLEAAVGVRLEVEIEGGKGGGEWFGGSRMWALGGLGWSGKDVAREKAEEEERERLEAEEAEGGDEGKRRVKDEKAWEKCFWASFDALKPGGDVSLLHSSLPLCMALQRAIIRQGSTLIDKSKIVQLKWFRLAAITEGPDLALFCNPATLSRLALWMVDALRDRLAGMSGGQERRTKSLPIVVACLDERVGTYVVVGVTGAPEYGDVRKNKFGLAFQDAALESAAAAKHDRFDTSVVEVKKEDLSSFMEALQLYATERMG